MENEARAQDGDSSHASRVEQRSAWILSIRQVVYAVFFSAIWAASAFYFWPLRPIVPRLTIFTPGVFRNPAGFSADGKRMLTSRRTSIADVRGPIELWDLETGRRFDLSDAAWNVVFSDDGEEIVTGDAIGASSNPPPGARFWDSRTGQLLRTLSDYEGRAISFKWSADSRLCAAFCVQREDESRSARGDTIRTIIWDFKTMTRLMVSDSARPLRFWGTKKFAYQTWDSASNQTTLHLWGLDTQTDIVVSTSDRFYAPFSADGRYVAGISFSEAKWRPLIDCANTVAKRLGFPRFDYYQLQKQLRVIDLNTGDVMQAPSADGPPLSDGTSGVYLSSPSGPTVVRAGDDVGTRLVVYDVPPPRSTTWVAGRATLVACIVLAIWLLFARWLKRRFNRSQKSDASTTCLSLVAPQVSKMLPWR